MNNIFLIIMIVLCITMIIIAISLFFSEQNLKNEIEKLRYNMKNDSLDNLSKTKDVLNQKFIEIIKENQDQTNILSNSISVSLKEIRESNEKKLTEIQANVNEKLDKSLNERLDNSFKTIGEQLQNLHKNLGELQSLSVGVDSLQKTLSNVKTRGVFGEIQLSNILANTMDKSQYEEQFVIKENKDERVDFAIKIPDKDAKDNFLYLPIDAKFPSDMYLHIVNASNEKNQEALNRAIEELRRAIEKQAKSIKDKYIDTPKTTAFAILFLPTEALYAEVLRIDGLAEKCQNEYNIIIQGPTTITALINSFSIGFKYLTVNKKAFEIGKTLEAIKGQYNIFSDLIIKTKKKLEDAKKATEDLSFRNEQINKKLKNIASLPSVESNKQLEINVYDEEEVVD